LRISQLRATHPANARLVDFPIANHQGVDRPAGHISRQESRIWLSREELNVAVRSIIMRVFAGMVLASWVSMVSGCGDEPRLVAVSGNVTLDGQPLEGATLSFVPVAGNTVSTAGSDVTGPQGNFKITHNGRAGLAPGKYKVLVSKTVEVASKSPKQISPIFEKAAFEKQLMGLTKEAIPPQKFEHEVDIPESGVKDLAFDFKSESKKKK
jgi:hypothetical protein